MRQVTLELTMPLPAIGGYHGPNTWLRRFPVGTGWYQDHMGNEVLVPAQNGIIEGRHQIAGTKRLRIYVTVVAVEGFLNRERHT